MKFWTIGHVRHPFDLFVQWLVQHQIECLVDVRRFPGSRNSPQFNRETLCPALAEYNIAYQWIESLGGRRSKSEVVENSPNEGWENKSFRNYADYMLTDQFQEGFEQLRQLAEAKRTAIMCSEAVYWRCHRRLISDYAVVGGGEVEHIFPDERTKPHTLTSFAKIDATSGPIKLTYPAAPSLFD
ncbi:DUF488 domain-containing protein [Roseimaritima ulvae]|uniref:DUF488 domain-containing protein n=1 Tax=Roseimaritima ulvae TaxID=980254 RepID=A0A5B9QU71_9BACT|nr:DUF488 domain-containing protein [Roseimaritima ulvae]QEG42588.1 hypothetical protein UC8_46300 [Roseimaritima ulvae]